LIDLVEMQIRLLQYYSRQCKIKLSFILQVSRRSWVLKRRLT